MARWSESWLPGAGPAPQGDSSSSHPGATFGLPAEGAMSVAGFGRRFAGLAIDWTLGYLIAMLVSGPDPLTSPGFSWNVLGIWFLLTAVPVAIFGSSAGMTAVGIRVASIDTAAVVGVPRALLRTALIALVLPAVIRDADGRGWHDKATRTIVVRTR